MVSSKSQKSASDIRETVVRAALSLAQDKGWNALSLKEIARTARIPLSEVYTCFEDKADILTAYGRIVDRRVMAAFDSTDTGNSPRDRLFDVLMERFDILNEDRTALLSILDDILCDPSYAAIALPHLAHSMQAMMNAAGLNNTGLKATAAIFGLTVLYVTVLKTWTEDESPDMSKTMAALDRHLAHAEKLANIAGLHD